MDKKQREALAKRCIRMAELLVGSRETTAGPWPSKVKKGGLPRVAVNIREGETYTLNVKKALRAPWATPQWARLVKMVARRSDGYVKVEEVDQKRNVAMVFEAHLGAPILDSIQVPLNSLEA